MTNLIYLTTLVLTNWVSVPADFKTEDGTNYVKERFTVSTNVFVEEVTLCTNRTLYKVTSGDKTNIMRWVQRTVPPPLPTMTPMPMRAKE